MRPSRQPFSCSELTTRWKLSIPANRKVNQRTPGVMISVGTDPGLKAKLKVKTMSRTKKLTARTISLPRTSTRRSFFTIAAMACQ